MAEIEEYLKDKKAAEKGGQIEPVVMWRGGDGMTKPVKVSCPDGLWPEYDSDGVQIFENTHFKTEDQAWKSIEESVLAGISLAGREVEFREKQLAESKDWAAQAAKDFALFRTNLRNKNDT